MHHRERIAWHPCGWSYPCSRPLASTWPAWPCWGPMCLALGSAEGQWFFLAWRPSAGGCLRLPCTLPLGPPRPGRHRPVRSWIKQSYKQANNCPNTHCHTITNTSASKQQSCKQQKRTCTEHKHTHNNHIQTRRETSAKASIQTRMKLSTHTEGNTETQNKTTATTSNTHANIH